MANPQQAVLHAAIVTATATTAAHILPQSMGGKSELPSYKELFGVLLTFAGLGMLADNAPGVAVPLAITIATTAFVFYGIPIMDKTFNPAKEASKK